MVVEHIEERNGGLYIKGKRVSLESIVYGFRSGQSPETIRQEFPSLSLADVYGAISYVLDHPVEVEAYLAKQCERWSGLNATNPLPAAFVKRLEEHRKNLAATTTNR